MLSLDKQRRLYKVTLLWVNSSLNRLIYYWKMRHQKSRNEHIWENSATETFKIKGKSNSAHFSLLQRIASLTAPELRVYHAQFLLALPYEQGFFLA